MPVTITLSTIPGKLTREDGYITKTVELFGRSLTNETTTTISTVPDIEAAVARFGALARAEHPDASFLVLVRLAKGHRKPNGFDTALRRNGFGQDDFLHVEKGRTTLTESANASASPVAPITSERVMNGDAA